LVSSGPAEQLALVAVDTFFVGVLMGVPEVNTFNMAAARGRTSRRSRAGRAW